MKPIEKTSYELFQLLRTRFSPMNIGDENADLTVDPSQAKFFSFVYREGKQDIAPVSVSIIDKRTLKVYYGNQLVENLRNPERWYDLLRELRYFAKSNLMNFDARDIHKDQLDTRDFEFIKTDDSAYTSNEVDLEESAMHGSKRKSYQTLENARVVVYHRRTVDEEKRGSRSRNIDSIFIENSNGERFRFPVNYLNGARAMARHISEGGTPYDAVGEYIVNTVREMRDLSRFKQISRRPAMENQEANEIRDRVSEALNSMKREIASMQKSRGYHNFVENFESREVEETDDYDSETLKEKFTRRLWNEKIDEVLPAVQRVLNKKATDNMKTVNELKLKDMDVVKKSDDFEDDVDNEDVSEYDDIEEAELDEAAPTVEKFIKDPDSKLILRQDPAADRMIRNMNFRKGSGLLSFIMSDIASRAIGNESDAVANFASQMAEDIGREGETFGTQMTSEYKRDRQLALMLAKKYLDDVKRMATDPEYADVVRKDPSDVYGKKKKRTGGVHEQFEQWADSLFEQVPGAVSSGTATQSKPQAAAALKKSNPQVIKALSGGDTQAANQIKRVSDKLARGQKLSPKEVGIAADISKRALTTTNTAAATRALAQDKHSELDLSENKADPMANIESTIEVAYDYFGKNPAKDSLDSLLIFEKDSKFSLIHSQNQYQHSLRDEGWKLVGVVNPDRSLSLAQKYKYVMDEVDENAFNQAAAAAARANKDEFEFDGKTYKTKMDKSTAHEIGESVTENEIVELFRKINK